MYFNNLIFLPLLLAGMSLAGEDTCPAGAVEVVVVETVTITDYSLVHPTTIAPSGASAVSSLSVAESTTPETLVASSAQTSSWTTVKQSTSTTSVSTIQPISSSTTATSASAAVSTSETFVGLGTRYGDDCTEEDCWQNGACSFVDYELPSGIDGSTCVSQDIWNNGANCGGCISVTYKGKTITVMVTNETGGNATHLDMTPATWSKLTNGYSGGGVDGIEWEWITCPIATTTPLEIRMHAGASKYWFAATVENARLRTAKLEVSSDSGTTWTAAVLENYNMWVLDGTLPSSTAWVRVTSVDGDQVVVEDVTLQSGVITQATENY